MAAAKTAKAVRVQLTTEQKIEALQKKIQQVKAADEKKLARELASVTKGSSAQETRKKILLGAFMLQVWPADIATLQVYEKAFAHFLVRDDDRALFNLPPLQQQKEQQKSDAVQRALDAAAARRIAKTEAGKLPNALRATS